MTGTKKNQISGKNGIVPPCHQAVLSAEIIREQ